MDQQDNKDFAQEWDDLLEDAFGSAENPIADIPESEPVKEEPAVAMPVQETPGKRPLYRRFWFWLILIVLATGLGIAAWFFLGKETDTEPTTPLDAQAQEAIDQCKAGLAQWQALESYYMTQSTLLYGDNMGSATQGEFWRSGDNFMQISYWPVGLVSGTLKYDGITYSARSYIPTIGTLYKNHWTILDKNATTLLVPWPMSFDLDASEIVNIIATGNASASGSDSYYTSISFSVLRSASESVYMYPCDVNFTFDVHGNLDSVTLVDVDPGEAVRTGISVITYRLGTTDYDIGQYIAEAKDLPLTSILSNLPVTLPE